MSIHGFCQNGKCKKPVQVELNAPGSRKLHLCAEDAAYYLHLRDEVKDDGTKAAKFVENCHKD